MLSGLRYSSPEELWASISPQTWDTWVYFYTVEPFGPLSDARHAAWLGSLQAASLGAGLSLQDGLAVLGHIASPPEPRKPMTLEEERAYVAALHGVKQ